MSRDQAENSDLVPVMHPPATRGRATTSLREFMQGRFLMSFTSKGGQEQLDQLMVNDFPTFMNLMLKFAPPAKADESSSTEKFLESLPAPGPVIDAEAEEPYDPPEEAE